MSFKHIFVQVRATITIMTIISPGYCCVSLGIPQVAHSACVSVCAADRDRRVGDVINSVGDVGAGKLASRD